MPVVSTLVGLTKPVKTTAEDDAWNVGWNELEATPVSPSSSMSNPLGRHTSMLLETVEEAAPLVKNPCEKEPPKTSQPFEPEANAPEFHFI